MSWDPAAASPRSFRPKLAWRLSLVYLGGAAVVSSMTDQADVWTIAISAALATWSLLQRIDIAGDELRSYWRLHRSPVSLEKLVKVDVYRTGRFAPLFGPRVVFLEDEYGRSTRFMLWWWQRPFELIATIRDRVAVEDGEGPQWRIDLDEEAESLLGSAKKSSDDGP